VLHPIYLVLCSCIQVLMRRSRVNLYDIMCVKPYAELLLVARAACAKSRLSRAARSRECVPRMLLAAHIRLYMLRVLAGSCLLDMII
jgi:hypothetical protein